MGSEETQIDIEVPSDLAAIADALADVLDEPRGSLVVSALEDKINELASDEELQRRIRDAVLAGELKVDTASQLLGINEATKLLLLQDELDRDLPEPVLGELPPDEECYKS